MQPPPDRPYLLGRAERRGQVFGWRPGQAVAVALGAAGLVLGASSGGVAGAAGGTALLALGVVVAVAHVNGRGLDEWVPVVARHWLSPRRGALCAGAAVRTGAAGVPSALEWPDGTKTTVAHLSHRGLRSLSDDPRALCEAVASWLRGLGAVGTPRCTVSLLCVTAPAGAVRAAPWADPGIRADSYVAVSSETVVDVAGVLAAAGVAGAEPLEAARISSLLADRVAPAAGTILDCDVEMEWHGLVGPAAAHAAFVVEEWPAGAIDEQALAPLFVSADRRTVCMTVRVEELHHARARTARLRTAAAADEELAEGAGYLASAESSRSAARDAERAAELAAGHGSVRLVGVVSVDAADLLELEVATTRLLADAAVCGLRLRRCDGDHARGVLATVPGWCVP